jgi:hypothetical protein
MKRWIIPLLLIFAIGCPKNIQQIPGSFRGDVDIYYPLKASYSWSYLLTQDGSTQIIKTEVVQINGEEIKLSSNNNIFYYIRTEEGILKRQANYYILKKPIAKGVSWEFNTSGFYGRVQIVDILKECQVRDHTYKDCLVVEETLKGQNILLRTVYAAGVGPVLIEEYSIISDKPHLVTRAELLGYSFAPKEED